MPSRCDGVWQILGFGIKDDKNTWKKYRRIYEDQIHHQKAVVKQFVAAVSNGDPDLISKAYIEVFNQCIWAQAWQALICTRLTFSEDTMSSMLRLILADGDRVRQETGDDILLARGLSKVLPPYSGADVKLWRGEGAFNHKEKEFGLSWTDDPEIALQFASSDTWRMHDGGSVLLEFLVPATAIICALCEQSGYDLDEREYLVDPGRLGNVEAIRKFSQIQIWERRCNNPPLKRQLVWLLSGVKSASDKLADTLEQRVALLAGLPNGSAAVKYLEGGHPRTTTTSLLDNRERVGRSKRLIDAANLHTVPSLMRLRE
jgi:hypothetical protein